MSKLIEQLKKQYDMRVICGNRWLVWDNYSHQWTVYGRRKYQKHTRIYTQTDSIDHAVYVLTTED